MNWARRTSYRKKTSSIVSADYKCASVDSRSLFSPPAWLPLLLGLVILPLGQAVVSGAPTTALQAQQVVQGWLHVDSRPFSVLAEGQTILRVDTHLDEQGTPAYHIVNLYPQGFVIVSADDNLEPIVGFAARGTFDPSPENPLGALVSRDMPGRLQALHTMQRLQGIEAVENEEHGKWALLTAAADHPSMESPGGSFGESFATLASISDIRVAPLVASRWSQTSEGGQPCYNYFAPNAYPCGCVATAMSQLMRFHQFPTDPVGTGSFDIYVDSVKQTDSLRGGDGQGGAYDWTSMVLDPDGSTTDAQRQAIGALCHDAGLSVNMSYGPNGSGAYSVGEDALVETFGYGNAICGYNHGSNIPASSLSVMINPNLDAGYPVLLGIYGSAGGHAIIADGYGYSSSTLYHHLNLGWGGYQDAWYNLPKVSSSPAFTTVDECGYNIFPTGKGEIISGRVLDGAGKPLSGATVTATPAQGEMLSTQTNARGIYAFAKVPSGTTFTIGVTGQALVYPPQTVTTGTSTSYGSQSGNRWQVDFKGKKETPPTATSSSVTAYVDQATTLTLPAKDDGRPSNPGVLSCIIVKLPTKGTLADPGAGPIAAVPYTLVDGGSQVTYTPPQDYNGSDSFTFKAYDGGTAPTGGYSKVATVSVAVKCLVYSASMDEDPNWTLDAGWAYGTPTGGGSFNHDPGSGATGDNVIGYNLAGDYPNNLSLPSYATTAAINCAGYVHTKLSFCRWLGVGASKLDKACIQVSNDGTHWTKVWTNGASALDDTKWQYLQYDISKVADNKTAVSVRFGMGPTASASTHPGWNIDDVAVTGDYYTPKVQFAKTASSGSEGTASADVPVVLSGPSAKTVTVDYAVKGGTAVNGQNYTLNAGTLTFDPGQTSKNITITVIDDQTGADNKTVQLALSNPTNATLGSNKGHTYGIVDNDPADSFAKGEKTSAGTVTGAFTDTQAADGTCESIKEGLKSKGNYSQLEHRWTFSVRGGSTVTFNVLAWGSDNTDGDDFVFAYSTDGTTWKDMLTVTKTSNDDTPQTFAMPAKIKGTVYVRVRDSNRKTGMTSLDTISVDQVFIHCEAPAAPAITKQLLR